MHKSNTRIGEPRNAERTQPRIAELDLLRGFAVLGIFWINIIYFGHPYGFIDLPLIIGDRDGWNFFAWSFTNLFVEGSMFALFSMLFGASALLLLDQRKLDGPRGIAAVERYYRRNLWLMAFGLLHAFVLLSPFDILFSYGILGLTLFPLRNARPVTLLVLGILLASVSVPGFDNSAEKPLDGEEGVSDIQYLELKAQLEEAPRELRDTLNSTYQKEELQQAMEEVALYQSGYRHIFSANMAHAASQITHNLFVDNVFDAGGMMLIGMALFKLGILSGGRSTLVYRLMMIIGYGMALATRLPLSWEAYHLGIPPKIALEHSSYYHLLARLPLAFGHIGLVMLFASIFQSTLAARAVAATGRMALSNYLLQTLFSIFVFYGFGLALFSALERYQLALLGLGFGLVQMAGSLLWLRYFHHGPFEALWRWLVADKQTSPSPSND